MQKHFLGSLEWCNSVGGIENPTLWTYDAQLLPQLPRIAIYINHMVFTLNPEDYTYDDKSDSSRFVIEVVDTIFQDVVWILGAPFLRKFPTVFRRTELLITLYCPSSSISCIEQDTNQDINPKRLDGLDISGSNSTETPWTPIYDDNDSDNNNKPEKTPLWMSLVVAYAIGAVLVVVLAVFIVVRRHRRPVATPVPLATLVYTALGDDETITVSSDADTIRSIPLAVRVQ